MQTRTINSLTSTANFQRSTTLELSYYRPTGRCIPLGFHTKMTDCAEKKPMVREVGAEPQTASAES